MNADHSSEPDISQFVGKDGKLLAAWRYDYKGNCWWCGQPADSGEHKHKKSDLVRDFGKGPWRGKNAVVKVVEGREKGLQSPGAAGLKFARVLCSTCNSARSQKADLAYTQFSNYIINQQESILESGCFQWSAAFGKKWRDGRNLVTAYWLKHIGCRLAEGGVEVDPKIIDFLNRPSSIKYIPLRMELGIHEDLVVLAEHLKSHGHSGGSFWTGDLECSFSMSRRRITSASSHWGLAWLRLTYEWNDGFAKADVNFWDKQVTPVRFAILGPESIEKNCTLCGGSSSKELVPIAFLTY